MSWAQPARGTGLPPGPPLTSCHSLSAVRCPGGKKLPHHLQEQEAGSRRTPPEITEGRALAKGARQASGPSLSPWPCGPLPSARSDPPHSAAEPPQDRSSPPHGQRPGSATQAQDRGHGRLGGGTHGATGLIPLAPFTLQSWVERREAWVPEVQGQQASQPAATLREGTGARGVDSCRAPPEALCNVHAPQSRNFSVFGSSREVSGAR